MDLGCVVITALPAAGSSNGGAFPWVGPVSTGDFQTRTSPSVTSCAVGPSSSASPGILFFRVERVVVPTSFEAAGDPVCFVTTTATYRSSFT